MIKKTYNFIKDKVKRFWKWIIGGVAVASVGTMLFIGGTPIEPAPYEGILVIYKGTDVSGSFEDGDILHALNARRIIDINTQHITKENREIFEVYLSRVMEYKFERISEKEIKRTIQATGEFEILSDVPNEEGEYMDVPLWIARRKRSPNHQIFGEVGQEYWFGGRTDASLEKLEAVWVDIEDRTEHRLADNLTVPFDFGDKYAVIKVPDFSNEQRGEYESALLGEPDKDGNQETLKARKYKVDYKTVELNSLQTLSIVELK